MRIWRSGIVALVIMLSMALFAGAQAQEGGDPERGGELYVENCLVCHGSEGQGRVGASLQNFPGIDVNAALHQATAQGVDGTVMPAWSEDNGGPLTEQQISDIVAYIEASFAGSDPIAPAPTYQPPDIEPLPEIDGDPSQGAVVYQENCEMCHGEQGRGRFGAPLAKSWPGVQAEVYVAQVTSDGIRGSTMPAWSQAEGGPLTQDQIENVTAYVLSLEAGSPISTPEAPAEGPLSATASLVLFGFLVVIGIAILVLYYRRA
ncbi:MAG: c-type cytochrome [Anaerolineales bacterium]